MDQQTADGPQGCDFGHPCAGDPVVLASYKVSGAGWFTNDGACEWHVRDALLDVDGEYSVRRYLAFRPVDPDDPWLPPGDDPAPDVYRELGLRRTREACPGIDWETWEPARPAGYPRWEDRFPNRRISSAGEPRHDPQIPWGRLAAVAAVLVAFTAALARWAGSW